MTRPWSFRFESIQQENIEVCGPRAMSRDMVKLIFPELQAKGDTFVAMDKNTSAVE